MVSHLSALQFQCVWCFSMSLRLSWPVKVEDFSSEKPAWISQPAIELTPKSSIPILITWYPHAYSINITIPSRLYFPWYSHDYPHYQKSDVNGLFSNISWITSHLTSYSHTNFPLHQQKYYNGEAPNDSEVDTPNFISYMVIICFLFGYYGLCDVFFPWYNHCFSQCYSQGLHQPTSGGPRAPPRRSSREARDVPG